MRLVQQPLAVLCGGSRRVVRRRAAQGIGGALLAEVLGRVIAVTEMVAARFVVVDAIDEQAAGSYAHHGFRQIPGSRRLVQKVSDSAAALS